MVEEILNERESSKEYYSLDDWLKTNPHSSKLVIGLIKNEIASEGFFKEFLSPQREKYAYGDCTEFILWDSLEDFASSKVGLSFAEPIRKRALERFCKENKDRFFRGYLFEITGMKDSFGRDISSLVMEEYCVGNIYCDLIERRKFFRDSMKRTKGFIKKLEESYESAKNSKLVFG